MGASWGCRVLHLACWLVATFNKDIEGAFVDLVGLSEKGHRADQWGPETKQLDVASHQEGPPSTSNDTR